MDRGDPTSEASGSEFVSRSTSEPSSASLRLVKVASLPEMVKPDANDEATDASSRWAFRGGRGRRAKTDRSRNLGDPAWWAARFNAAGEEITLRAATVGSRTGS